MLIYEVPFVLKLIYICTIIWEKYWYRYIWKLYKYWYELMMSIAYIAWWCPIGQIVHLCGALTSVVADNPASNLIGGFKNLSSAFRRCRHCLATAEETQTKVNTKQWSSWQLMHISLIMCSLHQNNTQQELKLHMSITVQVFVEKQRMLPVQRMELLGIVY